MFRAGRHVLVCLIALLVGSAVLAGTVSASRAPNAFAIVYGGRTNAHGKVRFEYAVVGKSIAITGFSFTDRCSRKGTGVATRLSVIHGRFSFNRSGVTLTGAIGPTSGQPLNSSKPPTATGTARARHGRCDSGVLRWSATAT